MAEALNIYSETPPEDPEKDSKGKGKGKERPATEAPAHVEEPPRTLNRIFKDLVEMPEKEAPKSGVEAPAEKSQAIDTDETAEQSEAGLSELSTTERQDAARRVIEARVESVQSEQEAARAGTPEAAVAEAAADYLANVAEQVNAGVEPEIAANVAYQGVTGEEAPELDAEADTEAGDESANPPAYEASTADDDETTAAAAYATTAGGTGRGIPPAPAGGAFGYGGSPAPVYGGGTTQNIAGANTIVGDRRRESRAAVQGLLVGGIVGYLLGRRRGRIRTERQLLPIQRALEKQVQQLHDTITTREEQIRKFVWERTDAEKQSMQKAREVMPGPAFNRSAETPRAETAKPVPNIEQLHVNEVLKMSETITVGNTTIRKVYETNLISERGLRRIVSEHLRGGDVRRVLTEELLIKEIGHELDPILRDRSPEQATAGASASSSSNDGMVSTGGSPSSSNFRAQVPDQATSSAAGSHTNATPALLVANVVALSVLVVLGLILLVVWLMRG